MFKLSPYEFYTRHTNEIKRYLHGRNNILNVYSTKFKLEIKNKNIDNLKIDLDKPFISDLENIIDNQYDFIILTDVFEMSQDIYKVLKILKSKLNNDGKILITSINPVWDKIIKILESLKLKNQSIDRSYIKAKKFKYVCNALEIDIVTSYSRQYFPFKLINIGRLINSIFEILLFRFNLGIRTYTILGKYTRKTHAYSKSVIIPAKNEEENLKILFERLSLMNLDSEYILICAESQDNTIKVAQDIVNKYKEMNILFSKQNSNGKANGVFEGLELSSGDVIAILDSDISVDPEKLFDFFEIIDNNSADFVNGTRMIYPMEKDAMRFLNKIGNKVFQYFISKVIFQELSDSLCGTKVFKRVNIDSLLEWRYNQKIIDPFADFDLIFSSAYSGLKIVELPIHYKARVYGKTQISRFKDGYKLLVYFLNSFYLFNVSKYKS